MPISKNLQVWISGLISAAIGGGSTAITTMIVAPDQFHLGPDGLQKVLTVAGVSALVSVANFLKQSPLPSGWADADQSKTVS